MFGDMTDAHATSRRFDPKDELAAHNVEWTCKAHSQ